MFIVLTLCNWTLHKQFIYSKTKNDMTNLKLLFCVQNVPVGI